MRESIIIKGPINSGESVLTGGILNKELCFALDTDSEKKGTSGHISKCSFGNGHSFDTQNLFHSQKLFLLINKVVTF